MGKLHELLAVEQNRTSAFKSLLTETVQKFGKFDFFQGHIKSLKMLEESEQNAAIELAGSLLVRQNICRQKIPKPFSTRQKFSVQFLPFCSSP